jgi:hypothetical protein
MAGRPVRGSRPRDVGESGTGHDRLITLTEGVLPEEEREDPEPLDELIGQQAESRELAREPPRREQIALCLTTLEGIPPARVKWW